MSQKYYSPFDRNRSKKKEDMRELSEINICEIFSKKKFQFNRESYYLEDEVYELPTELKTFDHDDGRDRCTPYDFD